MGIQDRKYMSDEVGSFGTIRGRSISAVMLLILINVAVWVVWLFAKEDPALLQFMQKHFMCSPSGLIQHHLYHTLLTCSISHFDPQHILFNLLFLWFLGRDVENVYGRFNFIALYIFAGLASSLAQVGLEYFQHDDVPMLGASGSIMGVAVVAAFLDPKKPMWIWGILPVPLWLLVSLYVVLDFSGAINSDGHVAHAAHLGGAAAGFLFYKLDLRIFASRGNPASGMWRRFRFLWRHKRTNYELQKQLEKSGNQIREEKDRLDALLNFRPIVDVDTARRVDELLAKISREGMSALSAEERAFLQQSSEKYRK